MANVYKYNLQFQLTTEPQIRRVATPRTAGWSEGEWSQIQPTLMFGSNEWDRWRQYRALLLPTTAAIVGYQIESYTMSGNKLLPVGSASGDLFHPGRAEYLCDVPQMGLKIGATSNGGPNRGRVELRGIPDRMVEGGEYNPTEGFTRNLDLMLAQFTNILGWVGRDLSQGAMRVLAYAANVITVDAVAAGLAVNDFIRFKRVSDENGNPLKGAYVITQIAGTAITIRNGPAQTVLQASGTCRKDLLILLSFSDRFSLPQAFVKKVGSPKRRYRGRRSKSRV